MHSLKSLLFTAVVGTALCAPAIAQGGLQPPPVPPGNPITAEKTFLGKALFWDEQMSSSRTVACATCHAMTAGSSDPRSIEGDARSTHPGPDGQWFTGDDATGSPGEIRANSQGEYLDDLVFGLAAQVTERRSMPVINAAYSRSLFWDGRAAEEFVDPDTQQTVLQRMAALESQALGPPLNDVEMAHEGREWQDVVARLTEVTPLALAGDVPTDLTTWIAGRDYPALFAEAFGDSTISAARIAMAIATYERTLFSDQSPIDDFLNGNQNALTQQEQRGFNLFNSPRLACNVCHGGPVFTDNRFHYTGTRPQNEDLGLGAVTGNSANDGQMKSPSLRNVELRAPYFHRGGAASLEQVVDFYNRGGDFNGPNKAPQIRRLNLNPGERADLLAFLRRPLTDPRVAAGQAPFDEMTLYSESALQPTLFGQPTASSSGIVPRMVAVEPSQLGNASLTVGVHGGMGGAPAMLVVDTQQVSAGQVVRGATAYLGFSPNQIRHIVTLNGIAAGEGSASVVLAVPANPALAGLTVYGQWFVDELGTGQQVAATEAASWVLVL